MSDFSTPMGSTPVSLDALDASDPTPTRFRDRATPLWAVTISTLFSLGGGVCLFAVAIFLIFFHDLVAVQGQDLVAALLAFGALVPILGLIIFEVGHARALAGFRYIRNRNRVTGRAMLGVFTAVVFGSISPILTVPFAIGAFLAWLCCYVGGRILKPEPAWDFIPAEAPSFLGGRDKRALDLANARPQDASLLQALHTSIALAGLVGGTACASWLVSLDVLAPSAIAAVGVMTYWSTDAFAGFARQFVIPDPESEGRAASVCILPEEDPQNPLPETGLHVHRLSIRKKSGQVLLSDISFSIEPGKVIGVSGDAFAGKSLLFQALVAPHDLPDLIIEGRVILNGHNLWNRNGHDQDLRAVLIPSVPLTVPGGGGRNLCGFGDRTRLSRAQKILKSLVFTSDVVDRIVTAEDARNLSDTELKALSFARALTLRPRLYLYDRPEDGAGEKLIGALANRAIAETQLGATSVFVTNNRQLLDACDKILMLQNGRLIEFADGNEIRERQSTGWTKFVAERDLDSEEALDAWLASHFRRDGDQANRRAVCMIANEMLSIACQSSGDPQAGDTVAFEFKHFAGHCLLRLLDSTLTLSSGAMAKAEAAARTSVEGERLSPLAKVIRDSLDVQAGDGEAASGLLVTIKTYDPRKQQTRKARHNEATVR
ncbi:ABC-type multidrug transport system ATPase subunit [Shimia isoporae]|uniref:ABC-type multidrug transport system ATPase subunit n=1 Tax=Shimia isoporae TaxID=647720 RepID=A0A4R1N7S2_9RHOB|nr:ATP-binding cassette domain-containing protein [Shimia isoporae]TCL01134.1 ABC-type multidrug transport system ATPase subunit [Shimia isoporae]